MRSRALLGLVLALGAGTPLLLSNAPASAAAAPAAGSVLAWGDNTFGYLGIGTAIGPDACAFAANCSTAPIQTSLPAGTIASSVASHHFSSLAITAGGGLLAWGSNNDGQLGIGST